jgi:signal transduction histidine kinase
VSFNLSGTYHELDKHIEEQLLRIAEESVTNTVRHSSASQVNIDLIYEERRLRLVVRDNGRGFDANAISANGRYGLKGMRERATQIGSVLVVNSANGQGTEISLQLDLGGAESGRPQR